MDNEKYLEVDEVCKRVEKVLRYAKERWLDESNPFWKDFVTFMRFRVKPKASSNPWLFAVCCWSFITRIKGTYDQSHTFSKMNYYLLKNSVFWQYFVTLAKDSGWYKNGQILLPNIGSPHLTKEDEPARQNWITDWPTARTTPSMSEIAVMSNTLELMTTEGLFESNTPDI